MHELHHYHDALTPQQIEVLRAAVAHPGTTFDARDLAGQWSNLGSPRGLGRTLAALQRDGYLALERQVKVHGRVVRRIYSTTRKGRAAT